MSDSHLYDGMVGFIAGTNGAIATVLIGQPLDTVKVKMQTFPELYKSTWACTKTTFMKDGLFNGLYAGTVPALVATVAENAVLFCALPFSQKLCAYLRNKEASELTTVEHALSGSGAAVFSTLALCPTELVKCKLQSIREMSSGESHSAWSVTKHIYQSDGLRGFTRGMVPTFAREVPGYFFFFGGYELCRSYFAGAEGPKANIGPVKTAICGGIGGIALWTAIFPFDVAKSRMQIGHADATSTANTPAPSMLRMLSNMVRNEGVASLYRGIGPTLLRTFPATGALFVAVEWTKKTFEKLS